jgi:Uma2 family endonuclease
MTFADAARLGAEEARGELEGGRFAPMTRSTWRHGRIMVKASVLLELWSREHPEFVVACGDPGAKLSSAPDTLRGPDVGVVRAARMPEGRGVDGWLEGAPDVAFEIAGDAQSMGELTKKALEYVGAGAKAVVVLDPDTERAIVFTPPDHVRILSSGEELDLGFALPGFRANVAAFF